MSTKLQKLREDGLGFVKSARDIAEKAQAENRPMTDAEKSDYDDAMKKGRAVAEQIQIAKADEAVLDAAKSLAAEIGDGAVDDVEAQKSDPKLRQRVKTLGLQIIESDQYKSAMAPFGERVPAKARFSTDPIPVKDFRARAKSLFTGASDTSAGAFVQTDQSGIVEMLGRRDLTLRDLISVRRTGSDTVDYVRQTSHTNNAAPSLRPPVRQRRPRTARLVLWSATLAAATSPKVHGRSSVDTRRSRRSQSGCPLRSVRSPTSRSSRV
jgi:HK97 family phage major capsid protein